MTRPRILPPLRRTARDAEAFARAVHDGQVDQAGQPYVGHLERVAKRTRAIMLRLPSRFWGASTEVDEAEQIAWLHDSVEDKKCTIEDLRDAEFSSKVFMGVYCLSHRPHEESYQSYIENVSLQDNIVLAVKLADMEDNADPARLALLPADKRARLAAKYAGPLERLRAAVEGRAGN